MQKQLWIKLFFCSCFISFYISTSGFVRISDSKHEEEIQIHVKVPQNATGRLKRSTDELPEDMDIDLPVEGKHVTLSLHRNRHISNQVPVTVQRNGNIVYQPIKDQQAVVYYYDRNSGSAFMVQRNTEPDMEEQYDFFGTFHLNSSVYMIQPPDHNHKSHSISQVHEDEPVTSDYILPTGIKHRTSRRALNQRNDRHKRETTKYEIEVLMVADYSVFLFWKDRAPGSTNEEIEDNARTLLRQYYAFLLSAIDVRYMSVTGDGYEIDILFAGLHIADTAAGSPWTEDIKNTGVTPTQVNSGIALDAFRTWMNDPAKGGLLPEHDHAMLFTGYDLERDGSTSVAGLCYVGGLCSENQQSINEDNFKATTATIGAHELGHNLGASHDGDGNSCPSNVGYVMEATSGVSSNSTKNLRLWVFSSCSIDYFTSFISGLNTPPGTNCMTSRTATYNASALDEYANQLLGQIYKPDAQCEATDGTGSYLCRQFLNFDYSTICASMLCALPVNNGTCLYKVPFEGTSCGNGKVCQKGSCVESALAPTGLTETCLFGDQPQTVAGEDMSCTALIAADKKKCYSKGEECCESCGVVAQAYANLTDCQYGNKADNCGTFAGNICYVSDNNRDVCCELCQNAYTGIAGCEYGDKSAACSGLSASSCYAGSNADTCCGHCSQFETSIVGCEYGDKAAGCAVESCSNYDDTTRTQTCCKTCAVTTTSPTTTTSTTTTTTPTTTTTTPTTTTTTPTTSTLKPTTTTTTPTTTTTTTPTTTTTTPTTTTTTPTTTTTTPTTTTTTPITTTTIPTTTTTTPTTTTTTPITTTTTPTTTTTTPTTTTTTPITTTTIPTTTTTTPTTTTTTPTTTTTTPTTTTTTPTTTTTTPTTTTTTPTTTTTTPTTTTTTPTTTTTTPTTTTSTTTTTTTTPTTATTTPTITTTTTTTSTTTPTSTTTTSTTRTTPTPTTTTTIPTTKITTTKETTTTTTPTITTTTPTTTSTTPTTTTTIATTSTATPTTTTTTTPTTNTIPFTTTTTPTTKTPTSTFITPTTTTPTTTITTPTKTPTNPTSTATTTTTATATTPITTSTSTTTPPITTTTPTTTTTTFTTTTTTSNTTTTGPTSTTSTQATTTSTAPATTSAAPTSDMPVLFVRSLNIVAVFAVNITAVNLDDPVVVSQTIKDLTEQLTSFYRIRLRRFRRVRIFNIWKGSLNVNYTVEFDNSTEAASEATAATIELQIGKETIEVFNQNVSASALVVDGNDVPSTPTDKDICQLYTSTIGGCPTDYECKIENSLPTCALIPVPDNLPFIIGVGVGVPICLLMLVLIAAILWQTNRAATEKRKHTKYEKHKRERTYEHTQQYFPSVVPYNAMNGWREQVLDIRAPFEYSHSRASVETPSVYKHSKNSKRHDSLYERHIGSYVYDNSGADFDDVTDRSNSRDRFAHKPSRHARY